MLIALRKKTRANESAITSELGPNNAHLCALRVARLRRATARDVRSHNNSAGWGGLRRGGLTPLRFLTPNFQALPRRTLGKLKAPNLLLRTKAGNSARITC